ncbi:ROK family transcriptional regulator [Clostridium brassicae]|uniref:ROK family transcriptional regulator n=1 Tax=Clostridium brassicae TaxID=2999072 RepID=A0ABT4DCS1_9CLOT|nr:ROK family transcriptional regulator [Clostridium brassicae]MCY6960103.1 ROK family transcriptional regulator [Clostridium brassicae]
MANSGTIKSINIKNILKVLNANESISKTDIAKYTGLSFPTVSSVIEYLIDKKEVNEVGRKDSFGGRCAKKYSLNPMYAVSLLLYLEGNKINWIINDFCRNRIESGNVIFENEILKKMDQIIALVKSRYCQLSSVIIGVASNINDGKIISKMEYNELQGVDIIKYFKDKYNIAVNVENDMNIAVRGYWERHDTKDMQVVVNIYIGDNGIGSSMVINGKVWRGISNFAGELHYLPICDDNIEQAKNGFDEIDIVEYYGKIIQSYIALINPNLIVIYNNSYISDKLEEVKQYCKVRIPEEAMPEIILSNDFNDDYEYGLSKMASELID